MSYWSYFTEMLNWFTGFCFVLQNYEQYYAVNTSQVQKSDAISSEYFYQMGFQHNIVTQYSQEIYPKTSEYQQTFV